MFDKRLFGYDTSQVDETINRLCEKIEIQQRDIDYLRAEKLKLKHKSVQNLQDLEVEK